MNRILRNIRRYSTLPTTQEYDVVIVGGGMVGGTLARALRTSKYTNELKIAVLDPQHSTITMKEPLPTPDIRCSALTKGSVRLFEKLGLAEIFAFPSSCAFSNMQIWDELNSGNLRFSSRTTEPMGFIVDNQVITHNVWRALKQDAESNPDKLSFYSEKVIDIRLNQNTPTITEWQTKLSSIQNRTSNLATITLSNGSQLASRLIVAADGPFSNSREFLGMKTVSWSYGQHAVVCCVQTEPSSLPKTAYQRFLKTGPIALLPMGNEYYNIVWSTDVDHSKYLLSLSNEEFLNALQIAFDTKPSTNSFEQSVAQAMAGPIQAAQGVVSQALTSFPLIQGIVASANLNFMPGGFQMPRIASIAHSGKRASFPLRRLHATEYVKSRFALVGDAAHTVHPLAGQGVNLGFGDVVQLTKAIQYAIQSGTDIGSYIILSQEYERPQFRRNEAMLTNMELIYRMYGLNDSFTTAIRGLGMNAINNIPMLKEQIMRVASGDDLDVSNIGKL